MNHQYINLNVCNTDSTGNKPYPTLSFTETRNSPILDNAGDYYLSVVRFTLETASLPVCIPAVKRDQNDPNKLNYTIGMSYKNNLNQTFFSSVPVMFVPQNLSVSPPAVLNNISVEDEYYHLNSITPFINMCNTAFETCFNNLKNQVALPANNPPYFEYDSLTGRSSIRAELQTFDEKQAHNTVKIYFNSPLMTLFNSYDAEFLGFNRVNNDNYRIRIINNGNLVYIPSGVNLNGTIRTDIVVQAEFSHISIMCPVQSIVFTSSNLPIIPSMSSAPLIGDDTVSLNSGGNNALLENVITDMAVPTENYGWKNVIEYTPTSEYRLIDMFGNQALNSIQINCFWKDQLGGLHPFKIASNCSCNLKIMFRKKNFN